MVKLNSVLQMPHTVSVQRGVLIHGFFEQVCWLDDTPPTDEELQLVASRIHPEACLAHSYIAEQIADFYRMLGVSEIKQALTRPKLSAGETVEVFRELPFAVREGEAILTGSIDRLVVTFCEGKPRAAQVIDYKTDWLANDAPAISSRVDHYRPQLQAYRKVAAKMNALPLEAVDATLLFVTAGKRVSAL